LLIVLVAAGAGIWLLAEADGDATRRHVTVDGVPLDEVHPPTAGRRPGVVVAHGFAGSARLMAQFGDSLAARGYVVVLPDFAGHGANTTHRLPDDGAGSDGSKAALQHDLDVAVAHLRALPDVDPARIALVGHSMGASTVTRYAVAHPEITATVAISLPGSSAVRPDRPARLLLLVGALEFPDFRAEAERAVGSGRPDRSMEIVPRVEHISILYARRTHRATANWLDDSFGATPADRSLPSPVRRLGGAAALLLALIVGLYPVAWLLLGDTRRPGPRLTLRRLAGEVAVAAVACAIAAVVARWLPTNRLPLAVGNYVIGYTALAGTALLAYRKWRPTTAEPAPSLPPSARPTALPARPTALPARPTALPARPTELAAPLLVGYAIAAVAVPLQLGLTHVVPVGARWWLLALVWAGLGLLAYAGDRLTGGNLVGTLAVSAVAVAVLTAAAATGITYGFVLLVVPLLAILLAWQAIWGAVLRRFAAPPWLIAAVGGLIVAWPVATTLPITG
jgi:dienelactone hydrolase